MATHLMLNVVETAKEVRLALKKAGVKAKSVKSNKFANGSSVDIYVTKEVFSSKPVEFWQELQRFTYGTFNPMNDSYESADRRIVTDDGRTVVPGAKYLMVHMCQD